MNRVCLYRSKYIELFIYLYFSRDSTIMSVECPVYTNVGVKSGFILLGFVMSFEEILFSIITDIFFFNGKAG